MYKCQVPQNLDQSLVSTNNNNKKKCKAIEIEITPNIHPPKKSILKEYKTDMFNMIKCIFKESLNFKEKICYVKIKDMF